ncbi:oxidoreductase [Rhodococcus triatomae]|uniref:Glucose/arabinose dehydrogenase, beta-propeller fold n=1 Tax=Rhodococcus triatomae TaxID=300028 RepID=A0A1G8ERR7_9NOCA|nr:PQQ-dependent sugar dehydrogenase [Rhodococcus triatomae]QNG19274.1 oxidoreductase [Rhodococcus triatomae]QNG24813.1 oxidoreductase [Rhodococcus triatomae]SDH72566.1 Glucose/arabinose dehydrogenase, beta-propeller fold [Rhodococcus triatomae]
MKAVGKRWAPLVAVCAAAVLVAGCARFDDSTSSPFTPEPSPQSGADVRPEAPTPDTSAPPPPPGPLGPCDDPDPSVVATCLDTTGGLVVLPDAQSALVAERRTGRILEVRPEQEPREIARVDVDGGSDGGLLDIALSPSFVEDNLLYAYVTTGSDNRVVRIAPGDTPKVVLGGIPKGANGNRGALEFASPHELMVLTGDTGNPAAAADPGSLAGKLLRLRSFDPGGAPAPEVVASGIGNAGGLCVDPGIAVWMTDRTALEDRLQRIPAEGGLPATVWTWQDRPGVGGCVAAEDVVAVSLSAGQAMTALTADPGSGAVTAAPAQLAQDRYGRLEGAAIAPDGHVWASTANKTDGAPTPTDDRVVKMPMPAGGGSAD